MYPLNENKVLGEETTVFIYDLKGNLLHKKVYQQEVVQISISKDKKNIIAFYGSVSGKPLEMGALGVIEVYTRCSSFLKT